MSNDAVDTSEELAGRDQAVPLSEIRPAPVEVSERLWSLGPNLFIQGDDAAAVAVLWAATEGCARVVVGERPPPEGLVAGDAGTPQLPPLLTELFGGDDGYVTYRSFVDALRRLGDTPMESAIYRGPDQQFAVRAVEGSGAFSAYFPNQEVSDTESPCAIRVALA